jgi:hypothetical protein
MYTQQRMSKRQRQKHFMIPVMIVLYDASIEMAGFFVACEVDVPHYQNSECSHIRIP